MMTKLDRMIDARDQLERVLRGLRADIRHAASMRDSSLCEKLRGEYREVEKSWQAMCRDVAELKHEDAQPRSGWARTIFPVG
jgi:hypothetical protein